MGEFLIKYADLKNLIQAYKDKLDASINQISYCRQKINLLIQDSSFTGMTAESIKAYMNDVHITMLASLQTTAQNMLDNIALYKACYYTIDSATNFVLTEEALTEIRSTLSINFSSVEEEGNSINQAISDISDLISLPYPSRSEAESSHESIDTLIGDLISDVSDQEDSTIENLENSTDLLFSLLNTCMDGMREKQINIELYQSGSFYTNANAYALAYLSQAFYEQHEENQDTYDQIWEVEDALADEADERKTEGIWETIGGVALVVGGTVCIVCTAGAATPIVAAGAVAGGGTAVFGIADTVEGSQNIYYGSIGDIDTESINLLKSTIFQGNEQAYQITKSVFAFTASALVPIGQASTVGSLTFRSGTVTVGKMVISDAAGAGASKITMDITGNQTLSTIAGMLASGATSSGLDAIDKRFSISSGVLNTDEVSPQSWYNEDGTLNYPPNDGAVPGTETTVSLQSGDTVGRYGTISDTSCFVTQTGVDPSTLSLPPNTDPTIYQEFLVVREISQTVQAEVAPWGESIGGGLQYKLPTSIQKLIANGFIVPK